MNTKYLSHSLSAGLISLITASAFAAPLYKYRVPLYVMKAAPALAFNVTDVGLTAQAGQATTTPFLLKNSGNVPVGPIQLVVSDLPSNVSLQEACTGAILDVGQECSGSVNFAATAAGSWSGSLNATSDTGASASITVSANTTANHATARVGSVTATPASVVADGGSVAMGQATVMDAFGNTLGTGIPVLWATTLGNLGSTTSITDAQGHAAVTLSSTVTGLSTLVARTSGESTGNSTPVTFIANAATAMVSSLTTSATSIAATGLTTAVLTATVKDGNGNALGSGLPATWSTSLGSLSASTSTTNASGVATITLTSGTSAGTATVSAKASSTMAKSAAVTFTPSSQTRFDSQNKVVWTDWDGGFAAYWDGVYIGQMINYNVSAAYLNFNGYSYTAYGWESRVCHWEYDDLGGYQVCEFGITRAPL